MNSGSKILIELKWPNPVSIQTAKESTFQRRKGIERVSGLLFRLYQVALWDLSSPIRDWSQARQWRGFPHGSAVKNPPVRQEIQIWSLGQEYPLEKEMATYSRILACKFPWTEEPGGLQKNQTRLSDGFNPKVHLTQAQTFSSRCLPISHPELLRSFCLPTIKGLETQGLVTECILDFWGSIILTITLSVKNRSKF